MLKKFKSNESDKIKAFFKDFGFVIIENAFTSEICEDFKSELAELIRAYLLKAGLPDDYIGDDIFHKAMEDLENVDHSYVASLYDSIYQCPSFMRIVASKNMTSSVRSLLPGKNAPLYGHTNRCRIDPHKMIGVGPMDGIRKFLHNTSRTLYPVLGTIAECFKQRKWYH